MPEAPSRPSEPAVGRSARARPSGTWDPDQYLRYAGNRARPFEDLLARIPDPVRPRPRISDLGCGPGNTTATLLDRWPAARITGVDNSPEMLKAAAQFAGPAPGDRGSLDFELADAADWRPAEAHDLILSNAALQWIPGHTDLFPAWIDALVPGGTLGFQVPCNFTAPHHVFLRRLAGHPRWGGALDGIADSYIHVLEPGRYLERLAALGCTVDAWETTYVHVLPGEDAVLGWVKGTALRPVLTVLDDPALQQEFLDAYGALLREAYPAGPAGTLFHFRRVFAVARKNAAG